MARLLLTVVNRLHDALFGNVVPLREWKWHNTPQLLIPARCGYHFSTRVLRAYNNSIIYVGVGSSVKHEGGYGRGF
jgi:hypothetical protein